MHVRLTVLSLLVAGFSIPVFAGFTSTEFTVAGDSRVGTAQAFASNPTGFTAVSASDSDAAVDATAPVPATGTLNTSVDLFVSSSDRRRAGTTAAASGSATAGSTLSMVPTSFASVQNRPVTASQYKGTGTSSVKFVGEVVANTAPGIAITYDAVYSMQAFAQNNAPGGFNNNSAYASVQAVLTLENLTTGTTPGQVAFIDESIAQTFCGPTGSCFPNNAFSIPADGTVFIPSTGQTRGDILRMTIEVTVSSDAYAKGFRDSAGFDQTAGGIALAQFDQLDVTLLLIPEPGSLALVLVGVGSVAILRRRRTR